MRNGLSIALTAADQAHLERIARNRNSPQKHVLRAGIVPLTAAGAGTMAIARASAKTRPWCGVGNSALCSRG
jgi:hypothetical protein